MLSKMGTDEVMEILRSEKTATDQVVKQLQQMDMAELNTIVSQVLGEQVSVQTWQATLLGGLDSSLIAGGVYRVQGTAVTANNSQRDWSSFVKYLRSPEGLPLPDGTTLSREYAEIQNAFLYWRREALVADSDLWAHLPAGLSAPHGLGTTQVSDVEIWLWQEMLPPDNQTWSWSDYREAAYRLGQWHGQTLTTQHSSVRGHANLPWLSQNWLAGWTDGALSYLYDTIVGLNGWQHPALLAHFAPDELTQLQQLWAERTSLLAQLAALPQTMCHLDAYRANMVWRGNDLMLLDWANVGQAALGEELSAFVGATLWFDHVPMTEAETLETAALDGYLAGLRAGGWDGDSAHVWQVYRCHMPLRYALNSLFNMLRTAVEPGFGVKWERKTNQPLTDILSREADYIRFLLKRFSKAIEAA
jgi:hypothetical protein